MIYLDNAATSYPKPPTVLRAIERCITEQGANPGRGTYSMAMAASRVIFTARQRLATLLGVADAENIVFTLNATDSLNLALKGLLRRGDHVVTTTVEHNSVTRPLAFLARELDVIVTKAPSDATGAPDPAKLKTAINRRTRLVVVTHASNVIGNILPIAEIAQLAHAVGAPILVDGAQTAGCLPMDIGAMGIDLFAFTGHKALLGPQGVGGLYISPTLDLVELRQGGTGSLSDQEQPHIRPDRYESGTPNTPGIAGLLGALEFIGERTVEAIWSQEHELTQYLLERLASQTGVTIYGPPVGVQRAPLASINVAGVTCQKLAFALDKGFDIAARAGLHCAPDAHRTIGTLESGTLRLSLSVFTTKDEIDAVVGAIGRIRRDLG